MQQTQNLSNSFSDQNLKLDTFLKNNQENFGNISNGLKELQDDLMAFKNEIDNTLKQIEMDLSNNQSLLSKWVSGSNNKLRQEQISQQRIALVDNLKKIDERLSNTRQDIKQNLDEFNTASQQLIVDFKNTENELRNMMGGQNPQMVTGNAGQALSETLQQVIDALDVAQQSIQQRNIYNQINDSIDEFMQQ